jgi:hypothetical protein
MPARIVIARYNPVPYGGGSRPSHQQVLSWSIREGELMSRVGRRR